MAHKVKVSIPYLGENSNRGVLKIDAELISDTLSTVDGMVHEVGFLSGAIIDAMPNIRETEAESVVVDKRQEFLTYLTTKRGMVSTLQTSLYNSGYYDSLGDIIKVYTKMFMEGQILDVEEKAQQFQEELEELQRIAETNYQKEYAIPSTDWRQGNSSGYLAAVKDILGKFTKIFKEDK